MPLKNSTIFPNDIYQFHEEKDLDFFSINVPVKKTVSTGSNVTRINCTYLPFSSRMLERILYSPMSFFDTTPLGRILNRFSKDMDIMDVTIPMNFRMLCSQLYNVVGTIVVICYTIPIFTAVVIPIAIMYYLLQKFYVSTAR